MAELERRIEAPLDRPSLEARRHEHELTLADAEALRPGIAEILLQAERLGLRRAIVSSASRRWVDRHLARLERLVGWDAIVTADRDRHRAKPLPVLYLEALDLVGLAPEEAIAFEDSPNGVLAATRAGIFCVAVPNEVTRDLGLDEADLVLETIDELPLDELFRRAEGAPRR